MKKEELFNNPFPLFETSSDPMILLDKIGTIIRLNDSALKMIGHKAEDLVGKGFMNIKLLTNEGKIRAVKNFAKRMLGKKLEPYEVQMYHYDGHLLDVEINAAPVRDGKKIIADLVSIRDISARKENEREIQRAHKMLDSIYQNVPVGIVLVDADGVIEKANSSLEKILGSKSDPVGLNLLTLPTLVNSPLLGTIKDLIENGQPFSMYDQEYTSYTGGKNIFATFIGEPLSDIYGDGRKYSLILVDDTTDLHDAHQSQLKKEKEVQKLKDQFVFVAAHELKTPVTAIKWGIEMLTESEKEVPEPLKRNMEDVLENISANNNRLSKLVSDLLDVARMDYGTFRVEPVKMDVVKVIHASIKSVQGLAQKNGITFIAPKKDSFSVYADPERVEGVLLNLFSNAIKYNKSHGSVEIQIRKVGKDAHISIIDSGIGFSKVDLREVFERFYRVERKEVLSKEGTGLGLYIIRNIIQKMRGDITVKSEGREKGSTFTFTLPLKK